MDSNTNTVATVNAAAAASATLELCGLIGCQNPTHDGNVGCNPFHTAIINQKELPESIGQLIQLQTLHLNINELKELPESIGQLRQLRSLAINQSEELP